MRNLTKEIIFGVGLSLLGTSSVVAAPTTVKGSYSLSYAPTVGSAPSLAPILPQNFVEQLNLNTPTAATNFFSVTPAGSCGKKCWTASGTITVDFTFSAPTIGNTSGTAAFVANYSRDSDSVSWNKPDPLVVNFLDGSVLDISLINDLNPLYSCYWLLYPQIRFDLVKGPHTVPEPASVAIMASGIILLGSVMWRRRRKRRSLTS